jgi:hypothetical protein
MTDWGPTLFTGLTALFTAAVAVVSYLAVREARDSVNVMKSQVRDAEKQIGFTAESVSLMKKQVEAVIKSSYLAKRPDILLAMTPRFDELYGKLPKRIPLSDDEKKQSDVTAFWSLQLEQYRLYLRGFIDDDAFSEFMMLRYREYARKEVEEKLIQRALNDLGEPNFKEFMSYVFDHGGKPEEVMKDARSRRNKHLKQYDPEIARILGFD